MFATFWATIKATRSAAYFTKALGSGSTSEMRQEFKNNPSYRRKVELAGIITAVTLAISARTIYRAIKKHHKNKKNKQQKQIVKSNPLVQPQMNQFENNNQTEKFEPKANTKKDEHTIGSEQEKSKPINDGKKEDIFAFDKPIYDNQKLIDDLKNLSHFKRHSKNDKTGTFCIKDKSRELYINNSGIFDKEHNLIINNKTSSQQLTIKINEFQDNQLNDIFMICENFI